MKLLRTPFALQQSPSHGFDQFLKKKYVHRGQTRLKRDRIFILPTYFGFLFGLMLFVMLLGSLNYNNNLAFVLTFSLGGVGLMCTYHTYRNLSQLYIRGAKAVPTFAGQMALFSVVIDNLGWHTRYAVSVSTESLPLTTVDIPENSTTSVSLKVPTTKRGRLRLGIVTIETRFPLGLYRAWSYAQLDTSVVVYPKPADTNLVPLPATESGNRKSTSQAGTDDFMGFRLYQAGDSTRHIHWKAVAKDLNLLTKQYARPESQLVWLDWEQTPGKDTEAKLSQLCRWVLDAHGAQLRYGLRLPGKIIRPARGDAHKHACLQTLALYGLDHDQSTR